MTALFTHAVGVIIMIHRLSHIGNFHHVDPLTAVLTVVIGLAVTGDGVVLIVHRGVDHGIPVVKRPLIIRVLMGAGVLMAALSAHGVACVVIGVGPALGALNVLLCLQQLVTILTIGAACAKAGHIVIHVVYRRILHGVPVIEIDSGIRVFMGTVRQTDRGQGQNHDQGQKRRKQVFLHQTYSSMLSILKL